MTYNEFLILGLTGLSLSFCLVTFKLGRRWVESFIICSLLTLYVIGGILVDIFGVSMVLGTPLYAGIFLATDMLSERYGKQVALRMVRVSLGAIIAFQGFMHLSLLFTPAEVSEQLFVAVETVSGMGLRMMLAGLVVYAISQTFDVWFYHFLHQKLGEKHLWLRNNLSTMTSQLIDTVLFFNIAFYGVVEHVWHLVWVTYAVKVCVALLDTPFMYLSKKIKPLDMADAEKCERIYKVEN